MESLLEIILQYGIASVAMVILSYVALQQMKLLSKMEERISEVSERIVKMEVKQDRLIESNEGSLEAIRACRVKNQLLNKR